MSDTFQLTAAKPAKPHRSPSQMGKYSQCGESFRRYYIEKERFPPVLAMLKGTGMHYAAAHNFRQKIESGVDLPVPQIVAAAIRGFDEAVAKDGVQYSDDEKAIGEQKSLADARGDVMSLAAAFATMQAPDYKPIAVEEPVRIEVPRSTHDLYGIMDLVAIELKTGRRLVVDFKNAKRKKGAADAAESMQLTFYAAGHMVKYGIPADEVRLDVLVKTAKGVTRQVLTEQRDAADFQVLANRINAMDQGIKAGVFLPAMPGSWWCSSKFCPYHGSCVFVNAARINAAMDGDGQ